jgi:hypothetical protein
VPRFLPYDDVVADTASGLMWPRDAALSVFPLSWGEALEFVGEANAEGTLGFHDWRLPNRRELLSLLCYDRINPALPAAHPFANVFPGYYWTSTTCCRLPTQAWYIHLGGARVYKGMKHGACMVWPVRSAAGDEVRVLQTGQRRCYDICGATVACGPDGQDGALQIGRKPAMPRFEAQGAAVFDRQTGLHWQRQADGGGQPVDWAGAFAQVAALNRKRLAGWDDWRLPTIAELERLTDMGRHSPALPAGHPFGGAEAFYWSSTTSAYETRYAWALYLQDGALGVGFKPLPEFFVWAVRGTAADRGCMAAPVDEDEP